MSSFDGGGLLVHLADTGGSLTGLVGVRLGSTHG